MAQATVPARRRSFKHRFWSSSTAEEARAGMLAVSPWVIGFLVLTLGPILASLYISLTRYDIVRPPRFVGLDNYRRIFTDDPLFIKGLLNSLIYMLMYVPAHVATALGAAMLLHRAARAEGLFRTLFYLPAVMPGVAAAILWLWILNPNDGFINRTLRALHLPAPAWTVDPFWIKPSIVIMACWSIGSAMLIFLAGLKNIPVSLYEAAAIDGANGWQRFRHVTLPLLSPITFFVTTLAVIGAIQVFTEAYVMFDRDGGPENAALFYSLYLFKRAFQFLQMGYASALAWILFAIIAVLTAIQFVVSRRWVYYDTER
jgi:multiple sugar transport system permease protein